MKTLLLLLSIGLHAAADQRWDFHRHIGLVRVEGDTACLAINDKDLKKWDDAIHVVGLEERPGRSFAALVESSVEHCPGLPGFDFTYRVSFIGGVPCAEVLGAATGVYREELSTDGRAEFKLSPAPSPHLLHFASCTEGRGVRVRLLSSHPTRGTQAWSTLVPALAIEAPPCTEVIGDWGLHACTRRLLVR